MPLPTGAQTARRTLERAKELDYEHVRRAHGLLGGGVGRALSLRFLRGAARRIFSRPRRAEARPVPRPAPGSVALTFVGHGTVMMTTPQSRVLTDPMLGDSLLGLRRAQAACLHDDAADEIDLILISHAHYGHMDRRSLKQLPRTAVIVVPPRCERLVARLGFADVITLAPGQDMRHRDILVTAVAARHEGSRGLFDFSWRGTNGYVAAAQGVSVYFAGDTGYFSGIADVGQQFRPDVAVLPITGYEPPALRRTHMSPLDAVAAFEDLGARVLVPVAHGSFPRGYEHMDEPLRWLARICAERGLSTNLAALAHGETCVVRAPVDAPAPLG